jgi:hypothetical protein
MTKKMFILDQIKNSYILQRNLNKRFNDGSPWSDKKFSVRAGHNSEALRTAEGQREGDRICPALSETFMSLHGDLHSIGDPWTIYKISKFLRDF